MNRTGRIHLAIAALVLACAPCLPRAALAQNRDDDARRVFEAAQVFYESGEFEQAGRMFEQAYALSQRTSLLYNAYLAYRDGQFQGDAARVLRRYLDQPDAQDRARLTPRLEALERANARALEGAQAEPSGSSDAPEAAPPPHAEQDDRGPGSVNSGLSPASQNQDTAGSSRSVVGPLVLGSGGAILIVGGVMGILATKDANRLQDRCVDFVCSLDDIALRDRSRRRGTTSTALLIGGGVAAAVGVVVWALGGRGDADSDASERARVDVGCDRHGCSAGLRGTF